MSEKDGFDIRFTSLNVTESFFRVSLYIYRNLFLLLPFLPSNHPHFLFFPHHPPLTEMLQMSQRPQGNRQKRKHERGKWSYFTNTILRATDTHKHTNSLRIVLLPCRQCHCVENMSPPLLTWIEEHMTASRHLGVQFFMTLWL